MDVPFTGECPTCLGCGLIEAASLVNAGPYAGQDVSIEDCPACTPKERATSAATEAA